MSKSDILCYCAKHGGDLNRASRAFAKSHGLPARDVLIGWKVILGTTNRPQGKEA